MSQLQDYCQLFFISKQEVELITHVAKRLEKEGAQERITRAYIGQLHQMAKTYNYSKTAIEIIESRPDKAWRDFFAESLHPKFILHHQTYANLFHQLGVAYRTYLASVVTYYKLVVDEFLAANLRPEFPGFIYAYKKMESLQMAIIAETYHGIQIKQLEEQREALQLLSLPISRLWTHILLLPLVGHLDTARAKNMLDNMLKEIAQQQAKVFIIDISGISLVDTAVANSLIKMTKSTQLMGCHCLLAGLSPSLAQTIITLGINVNEVHTTANLEEGLKWALQYIQK